MKRLVIVPVYNEEQYIRGVLGRVRDVYEGDVLAVNDGSTDGSAELIARFGNIKSINHTQNLGYGRSLINGFRYALENGYDYLVTIDCDEQHEPRHIPEIFDMIGNTDVLSGSRYLGGTLTGDVPPPDRYRINMTITEKINKVTHYNITDSFCGLKGYRVKTLASLDLRENGYAFPLEFWIQACRFGLSVAEFPVERIYKNLERVFGEDLDNPENRLAYYMSVLEGELERWSISSPLACTRTI
ncbi:MAG: glycosyltransferase family 2 protein [Nitrospinota bacterium]